MIIEDWNWKQAIAFVVCMSCIAGPILWAVFVGAGK